MKQVIGALLLGVGILIAGASGLCSLVVFGSFMAEWSADGGMQEFMSAIPALAIVGGIPFASGVGLFVLGRHLLKPDQDR